MRKINISDRRKISAIQKEFNKLFPYLKLEFFRKPHGIYDSSSKKAMKDSNVTIGQSRLVHTKGGLIITPDMTVADLGQAFSKFYGLSVLVFRKSGNVWLVSTATDGWTLEAQNLQGKELSDYYEEKAIRDKISLS